MCDTYHDIYFFLIDYDLFCLKCVLGFEERFDRTKISFLGLRDKNLRKSDGGVVGF